MKADQNFKDKKNDDSKQYFKAVWPGGAILRQIGDFQSPLAPE